MIAVEFPYDLPKWLVDEADPPAAPGTDRLDIDEGGNPKMIRARIADLQASTDFCRIDSALHAHPTFRDRHVHILGGQRNLKDGAHSSRDAREGMHTKWSPRVVDNFESSLAFQQHNFPASGV